MPKPTAQQRKALKECEPFHPLILAFPTHYAPVVFDALATNGDFLEALSCGTLEDKELAQIQQAGQGAQLPSIPKNVGNLLISIFKCMALNSIQISEFICLIHDHSMVVPARLNTTVEEFKHLHKTIKNAHRQRKRYLVSSRVFILTNRFLQPIQAHALDLKKDPCSCDELQAQGVPIISCNCTNGSEFKRGTTLVDRGNEWLVEGNKPFLAVPTDDSTWYVVPPKKSVIFRNNEGTSGHLC